MEMMESAAFVRSVNACVLDCCGEAESLAVNEKLEVPVAVGVPLIRPVAELRARPAGNVPAETVHVIGACPPEAERVAAYGKFAMASGSVEVPIDNAP